MSCLIDRTFSAAGNVGSVIEGSRSAQGRNKHLSVALLLPPIGHTPYCHQPKEERERERVLWGNAGTCQTYVTLGSIFSSCVHSAVAGASCFICQLIFPSLLWSFSSLSLSLSLIPYSHEAISSFVLIFICWWCRDLSHIQSLFDYRATGQCLVSCSTSDVDSFQYFISVHFVTRWDKP